MALDPQAQAALALYRFGLGPRAGSIAGIASDPRGALLAELDGAGGGRIWPAGFVTGGRAVPPPQMNDQSVTPPPAPVRNPGPGLPQQIYLAEAKARIQAALGAEIGFLERLPRVWADPFSGAA